MSVPQRLYYDVAEAAELIGMSPDWVYKAIAKGRRRNPPADAIPADKTRQFGSGIRIHRSYFFPDEPTNVTAFPGSGMTPAQIEAAVENAIRRLFGGLVSQPERKAG